MKGRAHQKQLKTTGPPTRPRFWAVSRAERGIALISVLWVLTLLAVITASFTTTSRTEVNLARNLVENAQAQALAEAGVQRAVFGLLAPLQRGGLRADGALYAWSYAGGEVRFSIVDEGGKVDLNAAQEDLLSALLRAADVERAESDELAAAIVDYRDANDTSRALGAEDGDYLAAGLDYDAKDALFEDIDELRQVLGVSRELFETLVPLVTVHTGRRTPHEGSAPAKVREALNLLAEEDDEGEDPEALPDSTVEPTASGAGAGREESGVDEAELEALLDGAEGDPVTLDEEAAGERSGSGVYAIHAEGRTERGAIAALQVTVRLAGRGGAAPYRVLDWRGAASTLFPSDAAPDDEADQ